MKNEIYMYFEEGMPKGTAQQKGERVIFKDGRPIIHHYTKKNVQSARDIFAYKLKKSAPPLPSDKPIAVMICLYFQTTKRKLWGHYKTTRPDAENFTKALLDVMTECGYWFDDNQVVDLRIVKTYAEKACIYIRTEELEP